MNLNVSKGHAGVQLLFLSYFYLKQLLIITILRKRKLRLVKWSEDFILLMGFYQFLSLNIFNHRWNFSWLNIHQNSSTTKENNDENEGS